ncbi:unnamed protein product, partial [Symbiodinium sp. CCMP2456]
NKVRRAAEQHLGSPVFFCVSLSFPPPLAWVMASSGLTPALEAVAAPASPVGAVDSGASPGVGLDFGTTSAPTTTAPGGLVDLDSLDGLEPTPLGAYASPGILPAEAISPGGAPGDHFIRSFVAGMSVPRLAAVIRALSPEDAANLRAALVEADATPDQDTAAVGEDPSTMPWSAPSASGAPGADQPTTDPGPSAPEGPGWDALTSYLAEFDSASGAPPAASVLPIRAAAKPKTVAKAPPPPFLEPDSTTPPAPTSGSSAKPPPVPFPPRPATFKSTGPLSMAPQPPPTPEAASSSTARAVVKAPPVLEPEAPSSSTTPPSSTAPTLEPTTPAAVPKKAAPAELQEEERADDAHRREFLRRQAFIRQEQAA